VPETGKKRLPEGPPFEESIKAILSIKGQDGDQKRCIVFKQAISPLAGANGASPRADQVKISAKGIEVMKQQTRRKLEDRDRPGLLAPKAKPHPRK